MSKESPIWGIDVSGWQRGISMRRVKQEGYDFVFVKATEGPYPDGSSYTNPYYTAQMQGAKNAGLLRGVYVFVVEAPVKPQVDHFLKVAYDDIKAGAGIGIDFEEYPAPGYKHLSPSNATLAAFKRELRRRVKNRIFTTYSNKRFWNSGRPAGLLRNYDTSSVAWDAEYLHMEKGKTGSELYYEALQYPQYVEAWGRKWGGVEPMFWQFTSTARVAGMDVDANAFRGTREQLRRIMGAAAPSLLDKRKRSPRWSSDGKHRWRGYTSWVPPKPTGSYIERFPTHTSWAPKAEQTAMWIERNYPLTTCINYWNHPPDANGFRAYEPHSLDVWGNDENIGTHDRGIKLDPEIGDEIWKRLWRGDGPGHPWDWAIYLGWGWSRSGGWWRPPEDLYSDAGHHFHLHLTLLP